MANARYINVADTAKLVREALAKTFGKSVKFSVRSKSYSGGASIDVSWTDGPTTPEVDRVIKQFEGATFDGMIDLKSNHDSILNGEPVRYAADFVFSHRTLSGALLATAIRRAAFDGVSGVELVPETTSGRFTISAHIKAANYDDERRVMALAHRMRANGVIVELKTSIN